MPKSLTVSSNLYNKQYTILGSALHRHEIIQTMPETASARRAPEMSSQKINHMMLMTWGLYSPEAPCNPIAL